MNCCVSPFAIDAEVGDSVIDCNFAAVTVSDADDETEPKVAVMLAVPAPTPVARPAATVATPVLLEVQVADAVRSSVVLSL